MRRGRHPETGHGGPNRVTDSYGTVGGGLDNMASGNSTKAVNVPEASCDPAAELFANGFEGN